MDQSSSSSRRVLSRNKGNDDEYHSSSSRHYTSSTKTDSASKSSSSTSRHISTSSTNSVSIKKDLQENIENVSMSNSTNLATSQQQQQQAVNYLNKEPFNEDIEIEESSLVHDLKWRSQVVDKFKAKIEEIKQLQTNTDSNKRTRLRDAYRQGLLLCSTIKKLNRVSHMRVNKSRIQTHEEKNKIDEFHLELQNLLYETSHYKKEINKCYEFRSLDEDINLVSIEEFYSKSPSDISKPDETRNNEHKLKLARLDWELTERQNMLARIKDLESQIELREQEIKSKQNRLESLHPKLNQIIEACKPTLEYFNTGFNDSYTFSEQVQYLPQSLYQFYMMVSAYRDTVDKDIKIEVCGDLEEAKRYNLNETITFDDEDSDSDDDDENYKKKKSKAKVSKKKANNRDKVFNCYPLSCKVTINVNSYGQLVLEFFYLSILKIVSVKTEFTLCKELPNSDSQILKSDTLLNNLFPKDEGNESPNLSNKFLFNNLGIKSIEPYLKNLGRPYMWCQTICGLLYENKSERKLNSELRITNDLNETESNEEAQAEDKMNTSGKSNDKMEQDGDESETDSGDDATSEASKKNDARLLEQVFSRLKSRFKARITLQETLNTLKNLNSPVMSDSARFRIQSNLTCFKETSYEKFVAHDYTKHLLESNLVNDKDCLFYEMILTNQNASLQAQIVLNQDYPKIAPLFAINVNWKYERNFSNDEAIRDMEREINVFRDNFAQSDMNVMFHPAKLLRKSSVSRIGFDERNYDLFAKQVNHLLVCFDIYLESESYYLQNFEHQRVKLFHNSVKGRDRKRPYSYLATKDIFVQRMQFDENESKKNF